VYIIQYIDATVTTHRSRDEKREQPMSNFEEAMIPRAALNKTV
jgi:hypothetical protein